MHTCVLRSATPPFARERFLVFLAVHLHWRRASCLRSATPLRSTGGDDELQLLIDCCMPTGTSAVVSGTGLSTRRYGGRIFVRGPSAL